MNGQICSLPSRWRTVWASDLHLGARDSADREFAAALNLLACDTLHLVGDTLDFWKLRRSWWVHWPRSHNTVLRAIKRKIDEGTEVVAFRGNHDEELRDLCGKEVG